MEYSLYPAKALLERARSTHFGKGEVLALVAMLSMSTAVLFQRSASRELPATVAALLNQVPMIALGFFGVLIARKRGSPAFGRLQRRAVLAVLATALLQYVLNALLYYRALAISGAVIVSSITQSRVIWAALLAWILLRQPLTRRSVTGLVIFLLGLVALAASQTTLTAVSGQWALGLPLSLFIAFSNGLTTNLMWYSVSRRMSANGSVLLIGLVAVACLSVLALRQGQQFSYNHMAMGAAFLGGSFQAVSFFLTTLALSHAPVISVYSIFTTTMIWSSLLAWLLLGDPLNTPIMAALVILFMGLFLAQTGQAKSKLLIGD